MLSRLGEMRVQITEKHIADGVRRRPGSCAVALAVKEAAGAGEVTVNRIGIQVFKTYSDFLRHKGALYRTPPAAASFIAALDNGKPVQPTEFQMQFVRRLGGKARAGS